MRFFAEHNSNWMVGDGYDSMFSLWNPSNQPEDLVATFSYPDGSGGYKLPVHLDPYASMNIDVASLIAQQEPDADGNVIPRGTTQGRVIVSSPKGLSAKINLALSSASFNVMTATCCPNCVCCFGTFSVSMSPRSANVLANGGTTQLHFMNDQWGGTTDDSCNASWNSQNGSIATVSAPSCTSGDGATVTGVGGGSDYIQANEIVNPSGMICNCAPACTPYTASDYAQVMVQVPTSLSIVGTDHTTPEASCPAGSFGTGCRVTRTFTYPRNASEANPNRWYSSLGRNQYNDPESA